MKAKPTPPQKLLKELFSYADGRFTWIKKTASSSSIQLGTIAGTLHSDGYRKIQIFGLQHHEHRLVWSFHNGPIPEDKVVDHINHDRSDNRIQNLQLLTNRENTSQRNRPKQSGIPVGIDFRRGRYAARLCIDGRIKHVGTFDTINEAVAARETFIK